MRPTPHNMAKLKQKKHVKHDLDPFFKVTEVKLEVKLAGIHKNEFYLFITSLIPLKIFQIVNYMYANSTVLVHV